MFHTQEHPAKANSESVMSQEEACAAETFLHRDALLLLAKRKCLLRRGSHGDTKSANPVDHHLDGHAGLDRSGADRGAASDQVTGIEGHVPRQAAHDLLWRQDHVGGRIGLALTVVDQNVDGQLPPIQFGLDHRADNTKAVKALGACPLREGGIGVQDGERREVIDSGIAEDGVFGLFGADILAGLADHDAELAFENHPPGRFRQDDRGTQAA